MNRLRAALAVGILLIAAGCGGGGKFTASGSLAIVAANSTTDDCSAGTDGYDDIEGGASVVIYDATGKKVALGSLKEGKEHGTDGLCVWDFSVPGVPKGKGPYGVEISHRGQVSFNEAQASSISVSLG